MIFTISGDQFSLKLRGQDIADELGVPCLFKSIGEEKSGVCVFVKWVVPDLMKKAKSLGNTIVYDPVDLFCNHGISAIFAPYVDVLLVPNQSCIRYYSTIFTNAAFRIVPHQWDKRLTRASPQDHVRTGYIGEEMNLACREFKGAKYTTAAEMLDGAMQCNLHLSLGSRMNQHALLKPATKIATAAAVGANVVAYQDASALEILPRDYPYYVTSHDNPMEMIRYAEKSFGGEVWNRGLEMMAAVKDRTSIQTVAKSYDCDSLMRKAA